MSDRATVIFRLVKFYDNVLSSSHYYGDNDILRSNQFECSHLVGVCHKMMICFRTFYFYKDCIITQKMLED